MNSKVEIGSQTAKAGFANEHSVVESFNNWQTDNLAQAWLKAMNYNITEIEYVKATKIKGSFKADVQVQVSVEIKLKKLLDIQNLQVKLVSNPNGFNQIDKRKVDKYKELWNIPPEIIQLLKYFTGEIAPFIENPRDTRRMFADEFTQEQQVMLVDFIRQNQALIISDILKGRGQFAAEWVLVILKIKVEAIRWILKPMNICLNLFGNGEVEITKKGSIKIGNITIQRKGGDGGRESAKMLQFKINPCLLFTES